MKIDRLKKKSIITWIILLMFLSLTLSANVNSTPIKYDYDGVWYDTFLDQNGTDTSKSSNYNFSTGLITLKSGINKYYYDFNDNKEKAAWASDLTFISGDESQLIKPRNLIGEFSIDSTKFKKKDGIVVETEANYLDLETFDLTYTFSPVHHFRFKIGQNKNNVEEFTFNWSYGNKITDANVDHLQLYVWDYIIKNIVGLWGQEGNPVPYSDIGLNPMDISFTSNDTSYISDDGYMDFLVVAIPDVNGETTILSTDYVNLTVTTKQGFVEEGWIVSTAITPSTLSGWESIIWKGSRASNAASIKIHVLDSTGTLITALSGNSEGFTTSPIDLSSLNANTYKSVRLKAVLESSDLSVTPRFYSWALTWQTKSNTFKDEFSTNIRIDELLGAEISGGDIIISDYYSDWPVFGRTPENRRSFEGYGPQKSELYWSTEKETVGGGFRSPVMSDDKIYIASADNMIYSFNATVPSSKKGSELAPYDISNELGKVDGSIAVADNLVIVATGEINSSNKVVALNKDDLKDQKWSYTFGTEDICYSSSPTVSDDKVFVTSWDGMAWNTPIISFLSSLIGGNNKVIALNLADGTKIWDATLPAGSFSTPAISDGMVFVGCDNIYGNNIFAFDEETGAIIWNASVGLIGGASPVVYQNKLFAVVKELKLPYITGKVKVVALDKQTGKLLWNKTLAEKVPAFENLPKGLKFYNLMATSTPAVNGSALYVTSPDGKIYALNTADGRELWSNELSSKLFGLIPTYSCTSPVVTSDNIYVAMINGMVYSLNKNGKTLWNYSCDIEDPELLAPTYILASPIVADGILYVSVTDEVNTFSGRICSIGDYTTYQKAVVISNPIILPTGGWWSSFKTNYTAATGSSITFSILDNDYNVLRSVKNLDSIYDTTYIKTGVIRLRAELVRKNTSQNPTLRNWSVTWSSETSAPDFKEDTFVPGGWINTDTPTCTIDVIDTYPGLNVGSARYQIGYKSSKTNNSVTTSWLIPNCTGQDGTKSVQQLKANISELNISDMGELKSIKIYIKDLAGNNASFSKSFQKDTVKPSSKVNGSYSSKYNKAVNVTVNATDDKSGSGIKQVTLYYRLVGTDTWKSYDIPRSTKPYLWAFEVTKSENYEFCSIAVDYAGNTEDHPSQADATFIFDKNAPYKPAFNSTGYYFNEPRMFTIKFEDDYKLKSVEYRLNFQELDEWTMIKDNINLPSYNGEWNLTEDYWDSLKEGITYHIYFKLTDICGNSYITQNNSEAAKIIKDLTVSKPYLDLSDFSEWHWDDKFNISANIDDDDIKSVELYYRYSSDNKSWDEWTLFGKKLTEEPFNWKFNAQQGSGYYQFKTRVTDIAGNVGESPLETIGVTIFPMIQIIIMTTLAFILIIITVLMLTRMKKKKT